MLWGTVLLYDDSEYGDDAHRCHHPQESIPITAVDETSLEMLEWLSLGVSKRHSKS